MNTLKELRRRHSLTPKQLAAKVGVVYQTVYAWEAGVVQPRLRHIARLADVLSVSPKQILEMLQLGESKTTKGHINCQGAA